MINKCNERTGQSDDIIGTKENCLAKAEHRYDIIRAGRGLCNYPHVLNSSGRAKHRVEQPSNQRDYDLNKSNRPSLLPLCSSQGGSSVPLW